MRWSVLAVLAVFVSGCSAPAGRPEGAVRTDLRQLALSFVPDSIRIHPLTHLELDPPRIVALVEFRDRWGDPAKGVGTLTVQLFEERSAEGLGTESAKWDVDLTDLESNAKWFDPVTRMYRVRLVDVPGWVADIARTPAGSGGRVYLRATLRTISPNGRERSLRHDFVVRH